jgi:hypothetical protein
LINNRLQKRNNLVSSDINRVFPINKLANGTAQPAQAPTSFREGIMKLNPNLFSMYEKMNKNSKLAAAGRSELLYHSVREGSKDAVSATEQVSGRFKSNTSAGPQRLLTQQG